MSYLKPQNPIKLNNDYIYPLTTADQVITGSGERLNSLFKKTIKENATLQVANWSKTAPYTQTITLTESTDDYNVDANVAYGDGDNAALNKAAGCISYIKKNHKNITFYCLKSKPEVDIPVEITGTCRNTIATIEEGIKLNFDIVAYANEEELLADTPMENTIGVITDTPITGYKFSATEPEGMVEGEVWIKTGDDSSVAFDIVEDATICPLSVKQYVNDAWANKTAMSYQNGKWVKWWNGELFDNGNQFESVTGGWDRNSNLYQQYSGKNTGTITINSTIDLNAGSNVCAIITTKNKINLTRFNTLYTTNTANCGGYWIVVHTCTSGNLESDYVAISDKIDTTGGALTGSLDISSLTGEYFVSISTKNNRNPIITEVKLL